MRRAVRKTRTAISPRLATRTVGTWWGFLLFISSHPEDAVLRLGYGRVVGSGDRQGQREPGVERVDDAVVEQPGRRVVRVTLAVVLLPDRLFERLLLFLGGEAALLHGGQDRGRLLTAHHRQAGVGPHPQEAGRVAPAAHGVVAGAEAAADDDGELRDDRAGD